MVLVKHVWDGKIILKFHNSVQYCRLASLLSLADHAENAGGEGISSRFKVEDSRLGKPEVGGRSQIQHSRFKITMPWIPGRGEE
jgi:hypothetical protein